MQVLNTLLGDGMSSRLFQNIREKYGFAYAVYSFNNMMQDSGAVGVYIGTDNSHVQRCIDLVWKELKSLRKQGITKPELSRTKAQLKGSMMLGMENIPNITTRPAEIRKSYLKRMNEFRDRVRLGCERNNVHYQLVDTSRPLHEMLTGYLAFRKRSVA